MADQYDSILQPIYEYLRVEMKRNQAVPEEGANQEHTPHQNIHVRSHLWSSARNITSARPFCQIRMEAIGTFHDIFLNFTLCL
jgi:hypothetical protein